MVIASTAKQSASINQRLIDYRVANAPRNDANPRFVEVTKINPTIEIISMAPIFNNKIKPNLNKKETRAGNLES